MMHTKPDAIHQRVQHFCPPPEILVPQLETLITSWEDVECSLDPSCGPLFSVSARKQAKSLIWVAQLGLISDPPGYPLYFACIIKWVLTLMVCLIIVVFMEPTQLKEAFIWLYTEHLVHYMHYLNWVMHYYVIFDIVRIHMLGILTTQENIGKVTMMIGNVMR